MRRIAEFTIVVAAVALSTLPLAAQDHTFHAAGTAPIHVAGATPLHAAGTFAPGHHLTAGPPPPVAHRREHRSGFPRSRYPYGYGYVYGVPYYLPPDNGYDQPDESSEQPAAEAQETRSGPTIFEHNGQVTTARSRDMEREEPVRNSEEAATPLAPTILVFRDGHQQEIENYAIAGTKLIVLGERPQKIQLSDLDLDATAKVNDDRGVDFKLPNQS